MTMKKTYIIPQMEIIKLQASQSILAGSVVEITDVILGDGTADNTDALAPFATDIFMDGGFEF